MRVRSSASSGFNYILAKQHLLFVQTPAPTGQTFPAEHGPRSTMLTAQGSSYD